MEDKCVSYTEAIPISFSYLEKYIGFPWFWNLLVLCWSVPSFLLIKWVADRDMWLRDRQRKQLFPKLVIFSTTYFSVALIFIVNTVGLNSSREKDAIYWLIYKNWNSISWLKGKALDYKFSQIGSTDKTLSLFLCLKII